MTERSKKLSLISFCCFFFYWSRWTVKQIISVISFFWSSTSVGVDFYINNLLGYSLNNNTYKSKRLRAVCMNHSFTFNTSTSLPQSKIILVVVILVSCLSWIIVGLVVLYTYIYVYVDTYSLSFLLKTRVWLKLDASIRIA